MKGQKAIALWMPIVLKGKSKGGEGEVGQGSEVIIDGLLFAEFRHAQQLVCVLADSARPPW